MIRDALTIHVDTICDKNIIFPKPTTKNKKASIKLYKHTFKLVIKVIIFRKKFIKLRFYRNFFYCRIDDTELATRINILMPPLTFIERE
jgi:hypothetical protein